IISILAVQFGYNRRQGISRVMAQVGMAMVALGTVVMMVMYVGSALANWSLPTMFVSGPAGANGIASDDVVTGTLVMGGGLLVAFSLVLVRSCWRRPVRLAAAWAWLLSFATVVVAGFAIEMNEAYFGAGDPAAQGAAKDAVFTWLHQDIGLFLFPTIALVMLAVERLINPYHPARHRWIGWTAIIGTTITFAGGLIFVFVDPSLHGVGYIISTAGLLIVGAMLLATIWWSAIGGYKPGQPATMPPVSKEAHMTSE
ncbi:MAG TPA: hypothetical protein VGT44_09755, partial [Ktedonobacteraceae bacterium]|nr:hypothetical protein [Ktedonobacteraceae bacterium]